MSKRGENMDFNKMTKQQLKDYGETIGIKLDHKKKKTDLIDELNNSAIKSEVKTDDSEPKSAPEFDIKQYMWAIIFTVLLVVVADETNFGYAAGVVTSMIVKDGLIFTLLAWVVMTKVMKRGAWEWYDWLNALAYTTVVARVLYVMLIG